MLRLYASSKTLFAHCISLLMSLSLIYACNNSANSVIGIESPASNCNTSGLGLTTVTAPITNPNFYKDLFPILDSSVTNAAYKCTTCHSHYRTPESMSTVQEINRVITSMRPGAPKFMPRTGNPVPEEYIKLFELWRDDGFPPGDPNQKGTTLPPLSSGTLPTSSSNSADSSNCAPSAT